MNSIEEAQAMDRILKYLIDNNDERYISNKKIKMIVFPNTDNEQVSYVLKNIIDFGHDITKSSIRNIDIKYFDCLIQATSLTNIFLENEGGFTELFKKREEIRKEKERLQKIQDKKLEDDAKLSRWQVKTFWWFFSFSLVGFCYGFYDFITDLKSDKSLDKLELSNRQLESELSKLRTLVLDQKTVDSLHNSRNHVGTLNKK